jgi:hypothetical protein
VLAHAKEFSYDGAHAVLSITMNGAFINHMQQKNIQHQFLFFAAICALPTIPPLLKRLRCLKGLLRYLLSIQSRLEITTTTKAPMQ